MARIKTGASLSAGSLPAEVSAGEVAQLSGAVREAARRAPGGAMLEVEFVLAQAVAAPHRVHRDPDLHPEAGGEGQGLAQQLRAHPPLPRDRRPPPGPP